MVVARGEDARGQDKHKLRRCPAVWGRGGSCLSDHEACGGGLELSACESVSDE